MSLTSASPFVYRTKDKFVNLAGYSFESHIDLKVFDGMLISRLLP